jgi:hypothetical protein
VIEHQLGIHLLEPSIFFLQCLEFLYMGSVHAVVFFMPVEKGSLANPILPADVYGVSATFILL